MNKRLLKEIHNLLLQQSQRELVDNDYIIFVDETNINTVHALIKAPIDSLYAHKFIRLDLKIPENYPYSPPEVSFINHDSVRIHPNMYENGKCCATILNTWGQDKFEKWTSSMGIETVLVTFHSFLDNNPYMYEPGGRDDPSYSVYVLYQSWITCLIRYIQYETIPVFREMIQNYIVKNIGGIFDNISQLENDYHPGYYYTRCFEIDQYYVDYFSIRNTLEKYINYMDFEFTQNQGTNLEKELSSKQICDYNCNVCFDTIDLTDYITISCSHRFHIKCLQEHTKTNGDLCPMCRSELTRSDTASMYVDEWMINPLTKRRIKIGGRTWLFLREQNYI